MVTEEGYLENRREERRKNSRSFYVCTEKGTLADTVEYQITGNQAHILKPGESLVRVALKFYGIKNYGLIW